MSLWWKKKLIGLVFVSVLPFSICGVSIARSLDPLTALKAALAWCAVSVGSLVVVFMFSLGLVLLFSETAKGGGR